MVYVYLCQPFVMLKRGVRALYEAAAIEADAETERSNGKTDHADHALCGVFQQVAQSDF